MRTPCTVLLLVSSLALCTACGDDDSGTLASDAGQDSGTGPDKIPRMDAGMQAALAVPACDRFDAASCDDGEVCNEVIQWVPEAGSFQIYAGCIEASALRGLGDPCEPWVEPYTLVSEEVYFDSCGAGLVCSDDPDIRGSTTCQPVCQSGAFDDDVVGCESDSALCLPVGAFEEVCRESDRCDPIAQTGCATGQACYLRLNDTQTDFLSLCLAAPEKGSAVADHADCTFINDCRPGSSCTGPVNLAPEDWTEGDYACRPLCAGTSDDADAGTDDAGVGDDCPGVAECIAFAGSSLTFSEIPSAPYGQCER